MAYMLAARALRHAMSLGLALPCSELPDARVGMMAACWVAVCQGEYLLIDGFPRKLDQGMAFEKDVARCTTVLFFDCPEDVMQERLSHN